MLSLGNTGPRKNWRSLAILNVAQNLEDHLQLAHTIHKVVRPAGLHLRLAIAADLLRDAPPGTAPRILWRDEMGVARGLTISHDLVVGRDSDCDIVFSAPRVSRRHCRIGCGDSGGYLADLGSANGTQVNGRPINPANERPLLDGDLIECCGMVLVYCG